MVLAAASGPAWSQPVRDRQLAETGQKLFPTVTALRADRLDPPVKQMLASRRQRIAACGEVPRCRIEAALWTAQEMSVLVEATIWQTPKALADDGVGAQASRELQGLNSLLGVYGLGAPPRYPAIDGPDDPDGRRSAEAVWLGRATEDDPTVSLDPSLALAIALLDVNNRDNAVALDQLEAETNAKTLRRAKSVDWSRCPFTALIVVGFGPEDGATALSARSQVRIRIAAKRFAAGEAPFIIVSGGAVSPRGTKTVEAMEMRRALMERFGIPAEAILIDPFARHTTTNLRNAARLLARLGAPSAREALIVTDTEHQAAIESVEFAARNQRELGYQPGVIGRRTSFDAPTFRPSSASSRVDPADPLDP
jgi:hypothetical protein